MCSTLQSTYVRPSVLSVPEPPVIETPPADQNATEGSTVVFKCKANGSPKVSIQWLFNAAPLLTEQFISIRGNVYRTVGTHYV